MLKDIEYHLKQIRLKIITTTERVKTIEIDNDKKTISILFKNLYIWKKFQMRTNIYPQFKFTHSV